MYTVSIRRRVIKDLENIPSAYVQLIMHHIDNTARIVTVYRVKHCREAYR